MLLKSTNPVLRDVIEKCDAAFRAGSPLIFIDTQERELAVSAVIGARDDELVSLTERPSEPDPRQLLYYSFVGTPPENFGRYTNLFFDSREINRVPGEVDRETGEQEGRDRDDRGSMDSRDQAFAAVIHLLGNNPADAVMKNLRQYVRRRVDTANTASPLANSLVIVYGDPGLITEDLRPYTTLVTVRYPTEAEIRQQLMDAAAEEGWPFEAPEDVQELAEELMGFSVMEVERMARKLLSGPPVDGLLPIRHEKERIKAAREAKKQNLMRHKGLLDLMKDNEDDRLEGMDAYKRWAEKKGLHMRDASGYALRTGLTPPKGVLLCGVPGCGKSEAAKILCRQWNLSMVRMNVDALMGGYVGDSERNLREALRQAEAMAPCILFIDELEKAFSGSSSNAGSGDGGTFKRMFGRLLTWMQDNDRPVFIIATANDIDGLPKEFFRSGRFDALFSVFMPSADECCKIFAEQMRRADKVRKDEAKNKNLKVADLFEESCYDHGTLSAIMKDFVYGVNVEKPTGVKFVSGADITKITHMALLYAGEQGWCGVSRSIKKDDWGKAVKQARLDPNLVTQGGTEAGLRDIAIVYMRLFRGNFVPASDPMNVIFSNRNITVRSDAEGPAYKVEDAPLTEKERGELKEQNKPRSQWPWTYDEAHPYDKALFNALKPHLERIGTRMLRDEEKNIR